MAQSQQITRLSANALAQQGEPRWSTYGHGNFRTHYWCARADRAAGRWACNEIGFHPQADDHGDHHGIEKNSPEPLGPGELLFFVSNQ
jgi:hypothetical protein